MRSSKLKTTNASDSHLVRCAVPNCTGLGFREDVCSNCGEYRCPTHAAHMQGEGHAETVRLGTPLKDGTILWECPACRDGPRRVESAGSSEAHHALKVDEAMKLLAQEISKTPERRHLALVMLARFIDETLRLDSMDTSPLERTLWAELLARHLDRYLRPQVEVFDSEERYIVRVDFGSDLLKFAVFTDGRNYHSAPNDQARDAEHNRRLKSLGWVVRRYWTEEVRDDHRRVCDEIHQLVCERIEALQAGELR